MPFRNSAEDWGTIAKGFHWLMAILIIGMFALGWVAESWSLSPFKVKLFVWHKSFGIVILVLALLRLAWRSLNPPPAIPGSLSKLEQRAARFTHYALYGLIIAMPVSGWVINSAANFPLKIFWTVPLPNIAPPSERIQEVAEIVHLTLFITLATLLAVHITAALHHHFVKHNSVLSRMLPGRTRDEGTAR